MSRVLEREHSAIDLADEEASTGRTTARALATAIAILIVSILVVTRSRAALERTDAHASANIEVGNVELTDDDSGSSLFAIDDMVPHRPESDCIVVSYGGNVLPVQVSLASEAEGDLAALLAVQVERGEGGAFHDCDGFDPRGTVYRGTLAGLASQSAGVRAFQVTDSPYSETFRFTFTLTDVPEPPDGADAGPDPTVPSASARFLWSVDPVDDAGGD